MTNESEKSFYYSMIDSTFHIKTSESPTIYFKLNNKGKIIEASYFDFESDFWRDFCSIVLHKNFGDVLESELSLIQSACGIWSSSYEILKLAEAKFLGKDYLYLSYDPVVCPCFGIRKSELKNQKGKLQAGCGSCLSQFQEQSSVLKKQHANRYFKSIAYADWMLLVDEKLKQNKTFHSFELNILGMNEQNILIGLGKKISQNEEEKLQTEIQLYLKEVVSRDFNFFLIS